MIENVLVSTGRCNNRDNDSQTVTLGDAIDMLPTLTFLAESHQILAHLVKSYLRSKIETGSKRVIALVAGLTMIAGALQAGQRGKQLYYNPDCTDFFWNSEILSGNAGEIIDRYVDQIADAGVTVFLCNPNARRTNYRNRVWDAFWDGYDPSGPDDQPS